MRIPAPAKINLHLRVGPIRGDGFHPLLSWMVTVGLFDTLTLVRRTPTPRTQRGCAADGTQDAQETEDTPGILTLSSDHPSLPLDRRNLVVRAAAALADHVREAHAAGRIGKDATGNDLTPVSAFLSKRIPSGAGLGGGSSDAAATLVGLSRLWRLDAGADLLSAVAAALGSDVPFFLGGASSICAGRGERVRPTPPPDICRWAVLVLPAIELSTAAVYQRFDALRLGNAAALSDEPDWAAWSKLPAHELLPRLVNDLEAPAFALRRDLDELRRAVERRLGRIVRMSGSGSSLFTLCDGGIDEAQSLACQAREATGVRAIAVAIAPASQAPDAHEDPPR